jgi:hypothetical protein
LVDDIGDFAGVAMVRQQSEHVAYGSLSRNWMGPQLARHTADELLLGVQLLRRPSRPPGLKVDPTHDQRKLSRKIDCLLWRQSVAQLMQDRAEGA